MICSYSSWFQSSSPPFQLTEKMPDDSAHQKILRLMGRGRDEYGSVPEDLRDSLERKDEYVIRNGRWFFKELVKSTQGKNKPFRIFSLKELQKATNNFSRDQILKHFSDYPTYRGIIEDRHVAVKIFSRHTLQNEVVSLSVIKHRNVVKLLGCCLETFWPTAVHELPPNGTLEENISKLSWTDRLRIATEIADALSYLHSELNMTHELLWRPEAVLLDEFHSAKLSAFDFSEIQNQAESSDVEKHISEDVTDFGGILLDLLCIQRDDRSEFRKCKEKVEILKYVKMNVSEKEMPQIEAYVDLFLRCPSSYDEVDKRVEDGEDKIPSMEEVVRELLRIRSM